MDLSLIVFNNNIYGMTGGQFSPTTPLGKRATTAPYGMTENPFDIAMLAVAAGASFAARSTTYHAIQMEDLIKKLLSHKGFSVLEIMAGCPTGYGRRNGLPTPAAQLEWQKEHGVMLPRYNNMSPEEKAGKFPIGVLHEEDKPSYLELYDSMVGFVD
jgi:2-oxoglutarate ferredoxin oxidoreductase subunit beta